MNKPLEYFIWGIIISAIGLIVYFYYFLFYPIKILTPNVQPYKILTPVVKRSGTLTYQVDACKARVITATVVRTFKDGGINYPSVTSTNNIPMGCHKTNVVIPIPEFIPPGKYHLELDTVYQVNQFRTVDYHFETETFEIIE